MKIKLLTQIALLAVICISFSCKNNDIDMSKIDFSNIENLYAQPLPVIQKCVEGKWQWTEIIEHGWEGVTTITHRLDHTFVNITIDSVVIDSDSIDLCKKFSYSWKNISAYNNNIKNVMWNDVQNYGWIFYKIKNDSLYVYSSENTSIPELYYTNYFLFLRVK